jgi:hypothetical protein
MAVTLVALALAALVFFWVFSPLFAQPSEISQDRPESDIREAVSKSMQELNTDLELHKIDREDLDHIRAYLEDQSSR